MIINFLLAMTYLEKQLNWMLIFKNYGCVEGDNLVHCSEGSFICLLMRYRVVSSSLWGVFDLYLNWLKLESLAGACQTLCCFPRETYSTTMLGSLYRSEHVSGVFDLYLKWENLAGASACQTLVFPDRLPPPLHLVVFIDLKV